MTGGGDGPVVALVPRVLRWDAWQTGSQGCWPPERPPCSRSNRGVPSATQAKQRNNIWQSSTRAVQGCDQNLARWALLDEVARYDAIVRGAPACDFRRPFYLLLCEAVLLVIFQTPSTRTILWKSK